MSHMQPHAFVRISFAFAKLAIAGTLLVALSGCTELARVMSKVGLNREAPTVVEQPATPTPAPEQPPEPIELLTEKPKPSKLYEWNADGRRVSRIVIDTNAQRARFFAGDEEIGWSTVASGVPKHPTPTGQFAVIEKVENKRSNLYGKVVKGGKVIKSNAKAGRDAIPAGASFEGAKMPYFMRLTGDGIGLHAGPIPRPGQPASHGCIRLPSTLAPVLFKHVAHGTPVTIVGSGPSYGNYVEKQRVAAARETERRRVARQQTATAAPTSTARAEPHATTAAGEAASRPSGAVEPTRVAEAAAPSTPSGATMGAEVQPAAGAEQSVGATDAAPVATASTPDTPPASSEAPGAVQPTAATASVAGEAPTTPAAPMAAAPSEGSAAASTAAAEVAPAAVSPARLPTASDLQKPAEPAAPSAPAPVASPAIVKEPVVEAPPAPAPPEAPAATPAPPPAPVPSPAAAPEPATPVQARQESAATPTGNEG